MRRRPGEIDVDEVIFSRPINVVGQIVVLTGRLRGPAAALKVARLCRSELSGKGPLEES